MAAAAASFVVDRQTRILSRLLVGASELLALPFERKFDPTAFTEWSSRHYEIPIIAVTLYLIVCFGGKKIMSYYNAYDLRLPLAGWNAFLCLFSFLGMCRTVPFLLSNILTTPFEDTICVSPVVSGWGTGPSGFWVMLFIFSKLPELIDTVFIVLRKKPLIFLHWYHHVTVLLFCWNSYSTTAATGLYFVAMNYTVHALMYGYYCLQALNLCPKSFPTILITMSQIGQMFVGTGVCASAWYFQLSGKSCHNDTTNLIAGGLMYGSYLYLFAAFALKRFSGGADTKRQGVKKLE